MMPKPATEETASRKRYVSAKQLSCTSSAVRQPVSCTCIRCSMDGLGEILYRCNFPMPMIAKSQSARTEFTGCLSVAQRSRKFTRRWIWAALKDLHVYLPSSKVPCAAFHSKLVCSRTSYRANFSFASRPFGLMGWRLAQRTSAACQGCGGFCAGTVCDLIWCRHVLHLPVMLFVGWIAGGVMLGADNQFGSLTGLSIPRARWLTCRFAAVSEPGLQIECDNCHCDLTHSIRIKCADPVCEIGDGVDICPTCFCSGKEFGDHKPDHAYRVVVNVSCNRIGMPLDFNL